MTQTRKRIWFLIASPSLPAACIVVLVAASTCIFILPLFVPVPFHAAISASYMAGFNNRAAALAAASISLLCAWWSWFRARSLDFKATPSAREPQSLNRSFVFAAIVITCAFTLVSAWGIHKAGQRYIADAGYFIEQMTSQGGSGRALYDQLEFAYGPLLFYPTIWIQRLLHCSMFSAYFTTLAMEQSLGLVELAYVLHELRIERNVALFGFSIFALGSLNPLFGLNYTPCRYLSPLALLLLALKAKRPWAMALTLGVGVAISLGISAEMGLAFALASGALVLYRARTEHISFLWCFGGTASGALLFVTTAGRSYFQMLRAFAGGALNLPVAPYPHLLIFLFAVVWMVPLTIGALLRRPDDGTRAAVACYAFGIALLPSALSRCDPLHVFFAGMPICLLSLLSVGRNGPSSGKAWLACVLLFVVWQVFITNKLFRFRTADTLSQVLPSRMADEISQALGSDSALGQHFQPPDQPEYRLDVPRLEQSVGAEKVATPLEITVATEDALRRSGHFQNSYYAFMVDTFSAQAEQRKIAEMNGFRWALIPAIYAEPFIETPHNLQDLQGFNFPYPQRNGVPFTAGAAMGNNLKTNWNQVDELGPYVLLRRDN